MCDDGKCKDQISDSAGQNDVYFNSASVKLTIAHTFVVCLRIVRFLHFYSLSFVNNFILFLHTMRKETYD